MATRLGLPLNEHICRRTVLAAMMETLPLLLNTSRRHHSCRPDIVCSSSLHVPGTMFASSALILLFQGSKQISLFSNWLISLRLCPVLINVIPILIQSSCHIKNLGTTEKPCSEEQAEGEDEEQDEEQEKEDEEEAPGRRLDYRIKLQIVENPGHLLRNQARTNRAALFHNQASSDRMKQTTPPAYKMEYVAGHHERSSAGLVHLHLTSSSPQQQQRLPITSIIKARRQRMCGALQSTQAS